MVEQAQPTLHISGSVTHEMSFRGQRSQGGTHMGQGPLTPHSGHLK